MEIPLEENLPQKQISKYLQSTVDGYVYVWTPQLAERNDMVPCHELPDAFKKEQKFNEVLKPADIRFMKKDDVIEEARVVYGFTFEKGMTATKMKVILRKLRKDAKAKKEEK
ncbi:hypothetical protein KA005_61135 [bacterium]|nr:hypothetical protein [bacterium]